MALYPLFKGDIDESTAGPTMFYRWSQDTLSSEEDALLGIYLGPLKKVSGPPGTLFNPLLQLNLVPLW